MRIIIAGAGAVGTHLAKLLAREEQDIVLLDEIESRLSGLDSYDLMTIVGSPTSLQDLNRCGVSDADLFIAVTPEESVNMTACMLAKNLGAKKTVARVDNSEYLLPENKDFFQQLGVNSLILPEKLAAKEIIDALQVGWIREIRSFCDNALVLLGIKIRSNAKILNKLFSSGYFNHNKYRIVAIKRESKTIIPNGSDLVLAGDVVYFITTKENMELVREDTCKADFQIKNILFMGGGHIAQRTIDALPENVNIKIFEKNREKGIALARKLKRNDVLIINGDGTNLDLLKEEDIENMDAFVAITDDSESNMLACLTAKNLGIKKTIAEIENIDYIDIADNLDIGAVINKKLIAASYIYQLTLNASILNLTCLSYSDAEVVEFVATENSKIINQKIKEVALPKDVNIGGIVRHGKGFMVNGDTKIEVGDHVVVFCIASSVRKIDKFF
ncbi:MAG: Trk system potassium transporter TrkA [Paludibacteraceae bacterium]|nr:Trk system potassium transporter TrkA [Paludibacteraceae bacterium]MBO7724538.1 Trk system potassium transporter TrkA [Paludibacteraceae bacterium]